MTNFRKLLLAVSVALVTTLVFAGPLDRSWTDDEIKDIKDIKQRVTRHLWLGGEQIPTKLNGISGDVTEVFKKVEDVPDLVSFLKDNQDGITDNVDRMFEMALEITEEAATRELQGLDDFLGSDCDGDSPCGAFRENLKDFYYTIELLMGELLKFDADVTLELNMQEFVDTIDSVPGPVLYPLYRTMTGDTDLFGSGLKEKIDSIIPDLYLFNPVLQPGKSSLAKFNNAQLASLDSASTAVDTPTECDDLFANETRIRSAADLFHGLAIDFRVMALMLEPFSATTIGKEAAAGGWAGVAIDSNWAGWWKGWFEKASGVFKDLAVLKVSALDHCIVLDRQTNIFAAICEGQVLNVKGNGKGNPPEPQIGRTCADAGYTTP